MFVLFIFRLLFGSGWMFSSGSVSFRFFLLRVSIEKALSNNIIDVLSLNERFLWMGPGRVCFLGGFVSLSIQVLLY